MNYYHSNNYSPSAFIEVKENGSIRGLTNFPRLPIIVFGPMPLCRLRFHRTTNKSKSREPTSFVLRSYGLSPSKEPSASQRKQEEDQVQKQYYCSTFTFQRISMPPSVPSRLAS